MDVRCERCRAQYVFDDDQVTPSGLTVQCTNCGHLFKVKKKELVVTVPVKPDELEGAPLPATAAAPRAGGHPEAPHASEPRGREWRVRQPNGNVFTFRELTTLQKWIVEQKVSRDDEISQEGAPWKRLGNIGELASFFQVVEAAERAKVQAAAPAVTPVPLASVTAVYGAPLHVPGPAVPPPPSGFPPPSFTRPLHPAPPSPAPPVAAPPPARTPAPAAAEDDAEDDAALAGVRRSRGGRVAIAVGLVLFAGGAAAYLLRPVAPKPAAAPQPAAETIAVPLTIEVKPRAVDEAPAPGQGEAANANANGTATATGNATANPTPTATPDPAPAPAAPALLAEPAPEPKEPKADAVARGVEQLAAAAKKPTAPSSPKALLAQADRVRQRGDAERALDLYGRLVANDPDNAAALAGRGLCYLDLEQYAPAEASFQAALRAAPGLPDALMGLAETYRGRGRKGEALQYYEQYLALHPDGEEAAVARNAIEELRR